MLAIRTEQLHAFRSDRMDTFEREMIALVRRYFPIDYRRLGEPVVLEVIRLGVERAERHGLTTAGTVCRYIILMFIFGSFFDDDPQYPWTGSFVSDGVESPVEGMERSYSHGFRYLDRVAGADGEEYLRAMINARSSRLIGEIDIESDEACDQLLALVEEIHPRKREELTSGIAQEMIRIATERLRAHDLPMNAGGLYLTLMLFLGSRFDRDPLVPWGGEILRDLPGIDSDDRHHRLRGRAEHEIDMVMHYRQLPMRG